MDTTLRGRIVVLAGLMALTALAPIRSHAVPYEIHMRDVDLDTNDYVPRYDQARAVLLPAGSTITWRNDDTLGHTVTAYYGSAAWDSPQISPFTSWGAAYPGGTVLYRCQYYSTLDTRVSPPACSGMCGAIHDTAADATPPNVAITTPNGFVYTGAVRIDGTADDNAAVSNIRVRIRPVVDAPPVVQTINGLSEDGSTMNPCIGCHGPSALWTFRSSTAVRTSAPLLVLPPGQYRVEATAYDPHGNSRDAAPITIYVVR